MLTQARRTRRIYGALALLLLGFVLLAVAPRADASVINSRNNALGNAYTYLTPKFANYNPAEPPRLISARPWNCWISGEYVHSASVIDEQVSCSAVHWAFVVTMRMRYDSWTETTYYSEWQIPYP